MMIYSIASLAMLVALLGASCKRKGTEPPFRAGSENSLQGKPDKPSEEPVGLPGYPLICDRSDAPGPNLTATVDCFLSDGSGKPGNLASQPTWTMVYQGPATITTSVINQSLRILISARTLIDFTSAMDEMQVTVAYNGATGVFKGRDFLRARSGQWIVDAICQNLFTITIQDASAPPMIRSVERFDGCEILSAQLSKVIVPNAAYRNLTDNHKTIGSSCSNGLLTFSFAAILEKPSIGPIDPQGCLDLSALINNLGL